MTDTLTLILLIVALAALVGVFWLHRSLSRISRRFDEQVSADPEWMTSSQRRSEPHRPGFHPTPSPTAELRKRPIALEVAPTRGELDALPVAASPPQWSRGLSAATGVPGRPAASPPAPTPAATDIPLGVLRGLSTPQLHTLLMPVVTVGLSAECGVVIDHPSVELHHAEMWLARGSWWVRALPTEHGIQVNGVPIPENTVTRLLLGDKVRFGLADDLILWVPGAESSHGLRLSTVARSHLGSGKGSATDRTIAGPSTIALASGIDGRPSPGRAARTVKEVLSRNSGNPDLIGIIQLANDEIIQTSKMDVTAAGMAATVDVVRLAQDPAGQGYTLHGAHLGDTTVLLVDDLGVHRPEGIEEFDEILQASTAVHVGTDASHRSVRRKARGAGIAVDPGIDVWDEPASIGTRVVLATAPLVAQLGVDELQELMWRMRMRPAAGAADAAIDRATEVVAPGDGMSIVVADVIQD